MFLTWRLFSNLTGDDLLPHSNATDKHMRVRASCHRMHTTLPNRGKGQISLQTTHSHKWRPGTGPSDLRAQSQPGARSANSEAIYQIYPLPCFRFIPLKCLWILFYNSYAQIWDNKNRIVNRCNKFSIVYSSLITADITTLQKKTWSDLLLLYFIPFFHGILEVYGIYIQNIWKYTFTCTSWKWMWWDRNRVLQLQCMQ